MKKAKSPREFMETILAGENPGRFGASFWRHFFHMENNAKGTAEAMLYFQKKFNWDFMKINPRADFHIEGWGFEQIWSDNEFEKHKKTKFPVESIEDWKKIIPLDINSPALAEHLRLISLIRKKAGKDLPILMTVFNPISIAGRMLKDRKVLADHLRKEPDIILTALESITVTFEKFASECRNAGADGLFFATLQWASSDYLGWDEYLKFGVPFDLRVMNRSESDAINILHVCHTNCYLEQLHRENYPASMYNWDASHPTNPPIDKAVELFPDKILVGGVDHEGWLLMSKPDEIKYKIEQIKEQFQPNKVILAPGCAIPPETPMENLKAIKEAIK